MYDIESEENEKNAGPSRLVLLAFAVIFALAFIAIYSPPSSTSTAREPDAGMACIMAEKLIKPHLQAPKSAEFNYGDCKASATHSGNTWTLHSYIDADNSYGAHIRTYYTAKLTNVPPSDTWRLVELRFLD